MRRFGGYGRRTRTGGKEGKEGKEGKKSDGYRDEGVLLSSLLFYLARPSPRGTSTLSSVRRHRDTPSFPSLSMLPTSNASSSLEPRPLHALLERSGSKPSRANLVCTDASSSTPRPVTRQPNRAKRVCGFQLFKREQPQQRQHLRQSRIDHHCRLLHHRLGWTGG